MFESIKKHIPATLTTVIVVVLLFSFFRDPVGNLLIELGSALKSIGK